MTSTFHVHSQRIYSTQIYRNDRTRFTVSQAKCVFVHFVQSVGLLVSFSESNRQQPSIIILPLQHIATIIYQPFGLPSWLATGTETVFCCFFLLAIGGNLIGLHGQCVERAQVSGVVMRLNWHLKFQSDTSGHWQLSETSQAAQPGQ